MLGYPHIAFDEAAYELGYELVEHITAQGLIVVPVEEFLLVHHAAKSDLFRQLDDQYLQSAIENVPGPVLRLAVSQWNPITDNPFAARRSPEKPLELTETLRGVLESVCPRDATVQGRPDHEG